MRKIKIFLAISATLFFGFSPLIQAVDVITNGAFDANITTGWTSSSSGSGTTSWDNSIGGVSNGSMRGHVSGRLITHTSILSQTVGTIDATDDVFLSLYWYKISSTVSSTQNTMIVRIIKPSGDSVDIWTNTTIPAADVPSSGTITSQDVSSSFNETGTYTLRLYGHLETTNNKNANHQHNFDDIILDVQANTPNLPPVVSDIPDQSVGEGTAFTTINLDDYVADPDNLDSEISWTFSGNTELSVDITARVATITAPTVDWNGSETITFTATDPGLLNDSDPATFTVTPVNDPPIVTDIPNQTVAEGSTFATITLDNFVSDVDNTDAEMTWTYSGNTELTVDITVRVATITIPDINWNGNETITFTATDPGLDSDSDPATFTVTAENDPPVVTDIPNQTVDEGLTFTTINLDDYVSDVDNIDSDMSWTYSGNTELTVDITARVATITIPNTDWFGIETITFTATDPGLLNDSDPATFTVNNLNDPPIVTDIPNQTIDEGSTFATINLDDYVSDIDNTDVEMSWTYAGNTELIIDITARVATITIPDINWNGNETITFTATDPGLLSDNDAAIFTVNAINDPPVVTDIPNQTVDEGLTFTTINLDEYVSDVEDLDSDISWGYSGNTELTVAINASRVATITIPDINWNGSETITFTATDLDLDSDSDPAIFTVNSLNDPPVVTDIPNQTVAEGLTFATISLDDYVSDVEDLDSEISWGYSGNTELTVSINASRVATITIPDINWNGNETITFTATDLDLDSDSDPATFTVTAENDPPVVTDIPNQTVPEGSTFATISLDDFVSDIDNTDGQISWTYSGNTELTVSIDPSRIATITIPSVEWNGSEIITFTATDPGLLFDSDPATFTVTAQNDPPVVTNIPTQSVSEGSTFATINLDDYVSDADNLDSELSWSYSGNTELTVSIDGSRVATITVPDLNWNGSEIITFTATDPGLLSDSDPATFTITPVNDLPTLTNGVTSVSVSPVNRIGGASTVVSATFTDVDRPAVTAFTITFKTREPNNITELTHVNGLTHGNGGLTVNNNGDDTYTASYTYNPDDAQTIGLYDLYFEVTDGSTPAVDDYANNLDEFEINEINNTPTLIAGATTVSPAQVARIGTGTTTISTEFNDSDQPGVSAFTVTFTVRADDNQQTILVNAQTNGNGGLTITDLGSSNYRAEYTWDPGDAQQVSLYDLYFEVSDGPNTAIDNFVDNTDELDVIDTPPNQPPVVSDIPDQSVVEGLTFTTINLDNYVADPDHLDSEISWTYSGNTELTVSIDVNRIATITIPTVDWNGSEVITFTATDPSLDFDSDPATFTVTPQNDPPVVADIPDQSVGEGSTFTTINLDDYVTDVDNLDSEISWTFAGNTELTVDITARVATITIPNTDWNGSEVITFTATDPGLLSDNNAATFTVTPVNDPPTLTGGTTAVSPVAINRIGANTTVISATFTDIDNIAVSAFTATFRIREPNNSTELTLVNAQTHGNGGLTIVDNGNSTFTASYTYNPDDAQTIGSYDLYFDVTDGSTPAVDDFTSNLDELSITETLPNQPPVVTDIPDQSIAEGATFTTINLDDFVSDPDNLDSEQSWTFTGNSNLSISISGARVATITILDPNWNGSEVITFIATDIPGGLSDSDPVTFTVTPINDPPVVADIPSQSVGEGISFSTINLDNYVSDVDNLDSEISWSYAGNTELIVDITARVATITAPSPTWNGSETITFTANDLEPLSDSDPATFTVTNSTSPPVVSIIPDQTVAEGLTFTTINLDNYVADPDNLDSEITWTYSGNTELTVSINGSRVATITIPDVNWSGSESIRFTATDPDLLSDFEDVLFTVTPENDPPIVTVIPNQTVAEGAAFTTINLDDYVSDIDNLDSEISWAYSGNTELTVAIDGSRVATITIPNLDWNGSEVITFTATDPGLLSDNDAATFTVTAENDQPIVTNIPNQTILEGGSFTAISLDNYVSDIDNVDTEISWTYSGNTELIVDITNRVATITTPSGSWNGAETITFTATDPGLLSDFDAVNFTVTAQNNQPVVSDIPNQSIAEGLTFTLINLDDYVADPDNIDGEITWTYSGNTELNVLISNRTATITTPSQDWNGSEVITFTATDPGLLTDNDAATFTVTPVNDPPTLTTAVTAISVNPVDRLGSNTTVISATFTDVDNSAVTAFTATFKIREPNNVTELTLVNAQTHGNGGLTIIDNGNDTYTASYTYNPADVQTMGLYDLYFEVTDGSTPAVDVYNDNIDELQINEVIANQPPVVSDIPNQTIAEGGTFTSINLDDYVTDPTNLDNEINWTFTGNTQLNVSINSSRIAYITTPDNEWSGAETVTFTATDPGLLSDNNAATFTVTAENDAPIVINIPGQSILEGSSFTTINLDDFVSDIDNTDAEMNWTYSGNTELTVSINASRVATVTIPGALWNGSEDITFRATDPGTLWDEDVATFTVQSINAAPTLVAGNTSVTPGSVDRLGANSVTLSTTFIDTDAAGVNDFFITLGVISPFGEMEFNVADNIQNGTNGLTVTANGGNSYTATISWDPPITAFTGYYDLKANISDGIDNVIDYYTANADELLITNGGENIPPIVAADAVFATPAGVERIGANLTTLSATFTDADQPGVSAFNVSFKVRYPNNITELTLADNAANGAQGVSISDGGGGIYTASVSWDPSDVQDTSSYDLYFHVTDGSADTAIDGYTNNINELQIYDAVSNNAPTLVAGNTYALPTTLTRIGSDFTMIKGTFTDVDIPGVGGFLITIEVRDQSSTTYNIVNLAKNDEQGLRVTHTGSGTYEASVLWEPGDAQATGTYDLYFYVEDLIGASATDDFTNNNDELTVTSDPVLGDGNLLRRTHDDGNCGGANSACHNIAGHQSQGCLVCHTPHGSSNIYLVKESITTPNSGARSVLFKTLGIGDPYNDPDPTEGDNAGGTMADDNNAVQTEVCEVCHTTTKYYRNDDSHTSRDHNNALDCVTICHPHSGEFAPSAGAESSGGDGCGCHSAIGTPMASSTSSYHHQINSENDDYTASSKTCLMCHVHHDIFRDDLNAGIGANRAANLRSSINTSVAQGSSTVFHNSDYSSTGDGGICLSCHTSIQTKSYTQPDGSTETPAISKTDYDAATTAHNYNVASTAFTDASTFNANCVKCHNDNMTKSYSNFGTHDAPYRRILSDWGTASTDPLEEDNCLGCHSGATGTDFYGGQSMTANSQKLQTVLGYTYGHPTTDFSGRHSMIEGAADFADGNRHAECSDCHNPHAAQQGTHDGSSSLVSNALKGAWGVEPTSWPSSFTYTDNGNVFVAPAGFTKVDPAVHEWQICLKCHSNYTTLPSGSRNLAEEINPNYPSTHGITIANQNSYCNSTTMFEPWGASGSTYCSDCHTSNVAGDPKGPHGSNVEHLLVATIVSDDVVGTPLCDVCHRPAVYWDGSAASSKFSQHPATKGAHQLAQGCFACHMWDYASTSGLGVTTTTWGGGTPLASTELFVHGQNKRWVFKDRDGSTGLGQDVDAFCNGMLSDVDYTNNACWSEVCKTHSGSGY